MNLHNLGKWIAAAVLFSGAPLSVFAHAESGLPPLEPEKNPSPAYARAAEIRRETTRLVKARDWKGLDALARELRLGRETSDSGIWLLTIFYNWAVDLPDEEPAATQALNAYRQWIEEEPQSITARICLASALLSHAWNARGQTWSEAVRPKGVRLFHERVAEAAGVLRQAAALPERCPAEAEMWQAVALAQGWPKADYFRWVEAAIRSEPTYGEYTASAFYYLSPDWHGEAGDFEAWIQARADQARDGDREYARYVWLADENDLTNDMVFREGRLDWYRTRRGFEKWMEAEPKNLTVRSEYARLAVLAEDRVTARMALDPIGGKYVQRVWLNKRTFEAARKFAYEKGPNPFREEIEAEEPDPVPTPSSLGKSTRAWLQQAAPRLNGFFGGLLAGSMLFLLARQRRRNGAGLIAGLLCIPSGILFGTPSTLVMATGLWLYLRRQGIQHPPSLYPPSPWMALLWVIAILAGYFVLQAGAMVPVLISILAVQGRLGFDGLLEEVTRTGAILRIYLSSVWLSFLGLLLVCGPLNARDWRDRLGLQATPWLPATAWTLLAALLVLGVSLLIDPYVDERSREAMRYFAAEARNPVLFFLSAAMVAPVFEELLFRGYAYSAWIQKLSVAGTAALSSFIFAICHFQYGWVGLLEVFFIGLVLFGLRWKTGSVYPSMALHALNNTVHCVLVFTGVID